MARELQTIYQYFGSYTKEQVDAMLEKLSEEEKALITIRYGKDLNNPVFGKLNKEQRDKFYGSLIPTMKRLLANPYKERKPRKKVIRSLKQEQNQSIIKVVDKPPVTMVEDPIVSKTESTIATTEIKEEIKETNCEYVPLSIPSVTQNNNVNMTKDDYLKILELLRTPSFNQMMSVLSLKESVIISLKLGYIDGKYFSTESIAQFLGIEPQEVLDATKKVLLLYKENINQFIDGAIQIVTEDQEIALSSFNNSFHK